MRALVQRVDRASVEIDREVVGAIGPGLLVLVGVAPDDSVADSRVLAEKIVNLRVLPDDDGLMNRSVLDGGGSVLVVSQFTLYGDVRRGRRPSWAGAAGPEVAEPLVEALYREVRSLGVMARTGRFGADMKIELVNNGPVTILLESANGKLI